MIPASAFFEFTSTKSPKAKRRFTLNGAPFMAIAGIWREFAPSVPPAFTDADDSAGARRRAVSQPPVVVLRLEDRSA